MVKAEVERGREGGGEESRWKKTREESKGKSA